METSSARIDSRGGIKIGDVLAQQYRVESVLGEGGMGLVYAVMNTTTNTPFAMKVVTNTREAEHITRFFREGRATMRISSEHVVRVFDVGSLKELGNASSDGRRGGDNNGNGTPYLVMERLDGVTLKALAEQSPLDERLVADLGIQACEGLAHAHAIGIVHRDVKPSNLFVLPNADGRPKYLKVLDFGISRMSSFEDWEKTATVTESHALLGSPNYVSPEQLQNPSGVDPRADVWSLGVSMYYALSGKFPFGGSSLAELLVAVMSHAPIPLTSRCKASPAMTMAISKCLERSLDRRHQSVAEVARALAPLASPEWALLVPKIESLLANSPSARRSAPSAPPLAERTLTADEPLVAGFDPLTGLPVVDPPTLSVVTTHHGGPHFPSASSPAMTSSSSPRLKTRLLGIGIALLSALVIAIVGVAVARRSSTPVVATTTTQDLFPPPPPPLSASVIASAEPAPTSSTPADPSSAAPELVLMADAPITKIIRPTARRVALEDGKASITVNPFRSDLAIEVEIAGGGHARGVAHANGPTTIHLVTTNAKGRPISKGGGVSRGSSSSELQNSPYDKP